MYSYHQVHNNINTYMHKKYCHKPFALSGGPDAAGELSVEFEEDLREDFLQHAILTLSWESPAS